MNSETSNKCQHEPCNCAPSDTGDYCSEFCETAAGGDMGNGCQCGHSECAE